LPTASEAAAELSPKPVKSGSPKKQAKACARPKSGSPYGRKKHNGAKANAISQGRKGKFDVYSAQDDYEGALDDVADMHEEDAHDAGVSNVYFEQTSTVDRAAAASTSTAADDADDWEMIDIFAEDADECVMESDAANQNGAAAAQDAANPNLYVPKHDVTGGAMSTAGSSASAASTGALAADIKEKPVEPKSHTPLGHVIFYFVLAVFLVALLAMAAARYSSAARAARKANFAHGGEYDENASLFGSSMYGADTQGSSFNPGKDESEWEGDSDSESEDEGAAPACAGMRDPEFLAPPSARRDTHQSSRRGTDASGRSRKRTSYFTMDELYDSETSDLESQVPCTPAGNGNISMA